MTAENPLTANEVFPDDAVLEKLIKFDEALRQGQIPDDLAQGLSDDQLTMVSLAARGLVELEGAFPRPASRSGAATSFPSQLGRFLIEGVLGSGGFAVVHKAYDEVLRRWVALKIPRPHALAPDLRRRFVREAQAAAQLDHPHIVPIYEAGEVDELPYIAYAYCDGPTLSSWVKANGPPALKLTARLMIQLAEAIQFSHARGILHRDIKPSNVLLFPQESPNDRAFPFTPRLSDLGLAKLIESSLEETLTDMVIGTPLYMSPEQAAGNNAEITAACDVYSLGAVLYFLLTGRPPFLAAGLVQTLIEVIERDPIAPLELNPAVDRDLNIICLKCLEKSPSRRYLSAQALVDDLRRYLAGEPIQGRLASPAARVWRWCRRKPVMAGLMAGVAALTLSLIGSLAWNSYNSSLLQAKLSQQNKQLSLTVAQLDDSLRAAGQLLYVADMQLAGAAWRRRDARSSAALLQRLDRLDQKEALKEFGWHYLHGSVSPPSKLVAHAGQTIWCATPSPDNKWLAVGGNKGLVQLFASTSDLQLARSLQTGQAEVNSIAFSPDSQQLATAGDDGTVRIWSVHTGELIRTLTVSPAKPVFGVAFYDQGRRLAAGGKSTELTLWETASGMLVNTLGMPNQKIVECLATSPDGRWVAAGSSDGNVALWSEEQQQLNILPAGHSGAIAAIQFMPHGRQLVTGGADGTVRFCDLASRLLLRSISVSEEGICGLAVSRSAEILCGDRGGTLTLLHRPSPSTLLTAGQIGSADDLDWQVLRNWSASEARLPGVAFGPDGDSLFTGDEAGQVRWWPQDRTRSDRVLRSITAAGSLGNSLQPGSEPELLYQAGPWGLGIWDVRYDRRVDNPFPGHSLCVCRTTLDGQWWLLGDLQGHIGIAPRQALQQVKWQQVFKEICIRELASLDRDKRLVVLSEDNQLVILEPTLDREVARWEKVSTFAVAPSGNWLVVARHETNDLTIIDSDTLHEVATRPAHTSTIQRVVFSRDGQRMFTASDDRTVKAWDSQSWSMLYSLLGHRQRVYGLAVSPDQKTLATADNSGQIRLWHQASGQELYELAQLRGPVLSLDFSVDGQHLYALDDKIAVHIFSAPHPTPSNSTSSSPVP